MIIQRAHTTQKGPTWLNALPLPIMLSPCFFPACTFNPPRPSPTFSPLATSFTPCLRRYLRSLHQLQCTREKRGTDLLIRSAWRIESRPARKKDAWYGEVMLGISEGKRRFEDQLKARCSMRATPSSRETK